MNKKGFTLIELLAVIVILGLLALIVTPGVAKVIRNSKINTAKVSLEGYVREVENAVALYMTDTGAYPDSVNDLELDGKNLDKIKNPNVVFGKGEITKVTAQIDNLYCRYMVGKGTECSETEFVYVPKNVGDPVYFNPNNGELCDAKHVNDEGENKEGCMTFYVIKDDGTNVDLILGHNTTNNIAWNETDSNKEGPDNAIMTQLLNDTKGWKGVNVRTDKYSYTFNDGEEDQTYEIDYNGYRARLITMHELIQMLGWYETVDDDIKADDVALANAYFEAVEASFADLKENFVFDYTKTTKENDLAQIEYIKTNHPDIILDDFMHVDLLDYLDDDGNSTVWGYWTSTSIAGYSNNAWNVDYYGCLYDCEVALTGYGVRPVISLTSNIFE